MAVQLSVSGIGPLITSSNPICHPEQSEGSPREARPTALDQAALQTLSVTRYSCADWRNGSSLC